LTAAGRRSKFAANPEIVMKIASSSPSARLREPGSEGPTIVSEDEVRRLLDEYGDDDGLGRSATSIRPMRTWSLPAAAVAPETAERSLLDRLRAKLGLTAPA
jgi:hypothetical protein